MATVQFKQLTDTIVDNRRERNWEQFHTPKDVALSLVLESTELLEHFQWKNGKELDDYLKTHKEEVGDELVDVLYWVLFIAHDLDIDLRTGFDRKMIKNRRKYPVDKARGSHKKYTELVQETS